MKIIARRITAFLPLLASSCVLVSQVRVVESGAPLPEPVAAFTVLSYNVAGLPEGISQSHPAAYSARIGTLLNGFDLALLQEDFFYHADIDAGAVHPYRTLHSGHGLLGTGDGLSVFSRIPIAEFGRTPWTQSFGVFSNASDSLAPKGFASAQLDLGDGAVLHVYVLHMDAGHGDGDRAARDAQAAQLIAAVRSDSADKALIIAGDFNMSGRDPGDAALTETLLAETGTQEVSRVLDRWDGRIDKILFRSGPGVRLVPLDWRVEAAAFTGADGQALSDHAPVSASFRVERP